MFTGLVQDIGTIARVDRRSDAAILRIATKRIHAAELELGESVAVNGVCLTVTERDAEGFTVLAGAETLRRTNIGELRVSARVNLERALRMGDRLGGHMVSGHVDAVGTIASRRDLGANLDIAIETPASALRYVIEKGSIAIDGISLTVNRVEARSFAVALIPHTVDETTLAARRIGERVNLEVDMIGKYVERLLGGYRDR
ncbi:riboflavin synthase [Haliangium ochraceum]|uniref:Riboflavin synthase n=1 Tax=Haliangium ochraceum (strain DSM 14365 / JCM 11303 / SMP-2) TaxID=502025 RepID=D0LW48_HALO1|nr:riboflavin synthase [Haliangium ochraceum]ACY15980.1 riboflavin synthase, alpha subunit [Haliangium ochraceum DSM 14365]